MVAQNDTGQMDVYLVTKRSDGHVYERDVVADRDVAVMKALELSGLRAPCDLSEWDRRQGNQHKPTRWWFWYDIGDGSKRSFVHIEIRKFTVDEQ